MGNRGRASSAEIAVIGPGGIETVRRPEVPEDLTSDQAAEWRAVVNRMPAGWFPRETHGMLAQYCRHVVAARRVAEMIQSLEEKLEQEPVEGADKLTIMLGAAKTMDRLLKMQEREGRAISSLATRMRISQQATVRHEKARKPQVAKKPWE